MLIRGTRSPREVHRLVVGEVGSGDVVVTGAELQHDRTHRSGFGVGDGAQVTAVRAHGDGFRGGAVLGQPLRFANRPARDGGWRRDARRSAARAFLPRPGARASMISADDLGRDRVEHRVPLDQRHPADPARFAPGGVEAHPGQRGQQVGLGAKPFVGA